MSSREDRRIEGQASAGVSRRSFLQRAGALAGAGLLADALSTPIGWAAPTVVVRRQRRGGRVTWAIEQDPVHLIPFGAVPTANHWGKEFMYDSLVAWDRDLRVQPALAESWEATDDRTYVFRLKRGLKFHDGSEVTAEDVKYSLELQANPPAPGIKIPSYPKISGVDVVDQYTARVNLSAPDPTLIGYLAWSRYSPIVPRGLYDKVNVLSQGIGTGPFKLVEYVQNDRVVYTRNPDFWNPALPYLDDLTLKVLPDEQARVAALRSGAVDGATVSADLARILGNDRSLTVLKGLFAAHREIQFTIKGERKPWHDIRVRQAISHAINRDDLIDKVYSGDAEYSSIIPPGYGDWPLSDSELRNTYLRFDLDRAKQLMADAGYASGFSVTLQAIAAPRDLTQCAEVVREQLKLINIDANVEPLEIGTFAKNNGDGSYDMQLTARGMRGDPSGYTQEFHPSTSIYKTWFEGGWGNDELNRTLDEALSIADQGRRRELYQRAQQILLTELPHIPLVQPYKYQVVRNRLKNMYVSYTDFNTGLREVWVED